MAKYNINDRVILPHGRHGTITSVIKMPEDISEETLEKYQEYEVLVEETNAKFVYCNEQLTPYTRPSLFEKYLKKSSDIPNKEESFLEMATVKWGFMSIKLAIYGDEGNGYPHFHFFKDLKPEGGIPESYRSGGGCLTIESPNYFVHGRHTEKLNPKEIKGLIKFLKERNRTLSKYTNWEYILAQWNDNNPDQKQLPLDLPIPDYKSDMDAIQEKE